MPARYERVVQELRLRIRQGRWRPGDRIPPEPALGSEFAVSRSTIRQAVDLLVHEGLLNRRQGSGTFVLDPDRPRRAVGLADFPVQALRGAIRIDRRLIDSRIVLADEPLGRILQVPAGSRVRSVQRFDTESGQPLSTNRCLIPLAHSDRLTHFDFASPLFTYRWEQAQGLRIAAVDQSIQIEPASPLDQQYLRTRNGTWVLVLSETYLDGAGVPLGLVLTRYRGDAYRFTSRLTREQAGLSGP